MTNCCVVVAEGSRARFFTLEQSDIPELEGGPDLVEHDSMLNTEHRVPQDQIYADSGGRNRSPGGPSHAYDEHRDQHDADTEQRFARDIAGRLAELIKHSGARRAFLCAEKRMLGFLRPALQEQTNDSAEVHEVSKDLAKLKPREIHERLADDGYIAARQAPKAKQ